MGKKVVHRRKSHKIETIDKAECVVLLLDYGATREQIMRWFSISDRTLRNYLKIRGRSNPVGRPPRDHVTD